MLCCASPSWHATCAVQELCGWFACLNLKAQCLSYRHVCASEQRHDILSSSRRDSPLLKFICVPMQGTGELVVLLRAGKLHACFVQGLFNLSLILAMGYGWKLKLSAKVFSISTFLKYFPYCVHIYLSSPPFPPPFFFFFLALQLLT